jgi:hypothetical protein
MKPEKAIDNHGLSDMSDDERETLKEEAKDAK